MAKTRFVALLRGVNVGGKNKLPMAELAKIFQAAECADVRTFIQSGNVVFSANASRAGKIVEAIETAIEGQFGFRPPIVLRTLDEMNAAITRNPFWTADVDENLLFVSFLRDEPEAARISLLDHERFLPDEFAVVGRELYLKLPTGAGKTKLTNAYFDSRLKTISTSRNWRTVNTLRDLLKPQ